MKDKNTIRTIFTFALGVIIFMHPEIFLYFLGAVCVYIMVMTIIDIIKDRNR